MFKKASFSFFIVLLMLLTGTGYVLTTTFPQKSGSIKLAGLSEPVTVRRDHASVPYIYAQTDEDAYFTLGFVHAQDRFWQMDLMRRYGAGKLSEILGETALGADKWMRTLGLYKLAEKEVPSLPFKIRSALEAYSQGVNQWQKTKTGLGAIEFAAFRYSPEPWTPADSLVWTKIMATQLAGNYRKELSRSRVLRKIGPKRMNEFWPDYPGQIAVKSSGTEGSVSIGVFAGLEDVSPIPVGTPTGASNQWIVSSKKSQTGHPLLANDPHLGFAAPIMWYLAYLESPGLNLTGATVPGVPFHILGHNGQIAWGITSTQADQEDLVVEKMADGLPGRYFTPVGPKALTNRIEIIRIKDQPDQEITIRMSGSGPILSDLRPHLAVGRSNAEIVALKAVYLKPGDQTINALYDLNRASNWKGFQEALRFVKSPVLNIGYADTKGNIGFQVAGSIPVRQSGDGSLPSEGWTGSGRWASYADFADLPFLYNPASGIIVNANNPVGDISKPPFISRDWAAPYRARRIDQVLGTSDPVEIATMASLQHDDVSLAARDLLPLLIDAVGPKTTQAQMALSLLQNWNGNMDKSRSEPLIFSYWLRNLNRAIHADDLGDLSRQLLALRPRFIKHVLTEQPGWCDDRSTDKRESCDDVITQSLTNTIVELSEAFGSEMAGWQWGDAHKATFAHSVFKHVPYLRTLTDLSVSNSGSDFTVNRGSSHVNNERAPFKHIHGPGYRGIYDLSDLTKSKFMIATGQSGNFLSSNYRDMLTKWRDGEYVTLNGAQGGMKTKFEHALFIKPLHSE